MDFICPEFLVHLLVLFLLAPPTLYTGLVFFGGGGCPSPCVPAGYAAVQVRCPRGGAWWVERGEGGKRMGGWRGEGEGRGLVGGGVLVGDRAHHICGFPEGGASGPALK